MTRKKTENAYTVATLSKISGVSVRTLHFYDEIGLLKPARYGENGYRYYEKKQLLLLQQILFYRELEFSLEEIRQLLTSPHFDTLKALESHKAVLQKDLARRRRLITTIEKTIAQIKGGKTMKAEELYEGFDPKKQEEYEKYMIDRYGEFAREKIAESKKKMKNWKKEDIERTQKQVTELHQMLAELINQGAAESDPRVQGVIQKHYQWVCQFWTPNKEAYAGLGQLYVDHPDFRKLYDSFNPSLADFMKKAMRIFADRNL